MLSRTADFGFWTPTNETVAAIGSVVCAHWTAAKAAAKNQFWRSPQNWLDMPRHYLNSANRPANC